MECTRSTYIAQYLAIVKDQQGFRVENMVGAAGRKAPDDYRLVHNVHYLAKYLNALLSTNLFNFGDRNIGINDFVLTGKIGLGFSGQSWFSFIVVAFLPRSHLRFVLFRRA